MNPPNFAHIDRLFDQYLSEVQGYAKQYFEEEFRPFLDLHGISFVQGMGRFRTYNRKTGKEFFLDSCPKWKNIYEDLRTVVPGTNNGFAEFMPDHRPELESKQEVKDA